MMHTAGPGRSPREIVAPGVEKPSYPECPHAFERKYHSFCRIGDLANGLLAGTDAADTVFEERCVYYPEVTRGLPKFRIVETIDPSLWNGPRTLVRDSFGDGIYIERGLVEEYCSPRCRCHYLCQMSSDFCFRVFHHHTKSHDIVKIIVEDKYLEDILVETLGPEQKSFSNTPACWSGSDLLSRSSGLKRRLQNATDAPVGAIDSKLLLSLGLLVYGYLRRYRFFDGRAVKVEFSEIAADPTAKTYRTVSDVLANLLSEDINDKAIDEPSVAVHIGLNPEATTERVGEKVSQVRTNVREFFIQEYHRVKAHMISLLGPIGEMSNIFHEAILVWRTGLQVLQEISYGFLPYELGRVMAFLCTCRAVSRTLDKLKPSNERPRLLVSGHVGQSSERFCEELLRWSCLFYGMERYYFEELTRTLWGATVMGIKRQLYHWKTDYHQSIKSARDVRLQRLRTGADRYFKIPTLKGNIHSYHVQLRLEISQDSMPPNKRPLRDSTEYSRTGGRRDPYHMSVRWANLLSGPIFEDMQEFLLWLNNSQTMDMLQSDFFNRLGNLPKFPNIEVESQSLTSTPQSNRALALELQTVPITQLVDTSKELDKSDQQNDVDSDGGGQLQETPGSTSTNQQAFQRTIKRRSTNRHVCKASGCGKLFSRKEYADRHYKEIHGELRHYCKGCNKEYNRRYYEIHKCNSKKPLRIQK
ncbi:hypothetical protein ABW21_db0207009 [Orbilia brochopaga]|nr:hypothetical protein ABW21_db0207009 [Drechslerella brochopaga]